MKLNLSCAALTATALRLSHRLTRRTNRTEPQNRSSRRTRRRGASAVEFAVVAPFFFVLIFGILEVGRLVMVQQVLTTASREGARLAIVDGSVVSDVQAAVQSYLTNSAVSGATVSTTPATLGATQPGDPITVTVTVPFADVSWLSSPWFFESTTLTASSLMRREGIR